MSLARPSASPLRCSGGAQRAEQAGPVNVSVLLDLVISNSLLLSHSAGLRFVEVIVWVVELTPSSTTRAEPKSVITARLDWLTRIFS